MGIRESRPGLMIEIASPPQTGTAVLPDDLPAVLTELALDTVEADVAKYDFGKAPGIWSP